MLIRARPEFSQTRWLHALFVRCLGTRELSSAMFAIAQAALLGNYTHATAPPAPYATRKAFIAGITQTSAAAMCNSLQAQEHLRCWCCATART